jgi:superfamily II DNA or RNA helicase
LDNAAALLPLPAKEHKYIFQGLTVAHLTATIIAQHTPQGIYFPDISLADIAVENIGVNQGVFTKKKQQVHFPLVTVTQQDAHLILTCDCNDTTTKLCLHEAEILTAIILHNDIGIFFKPGYRHLQLQQIAKVYGLEQEANLDIHFDLSYEQGKLSVIPKNAAIIAVTAPALQGLQAQLQLDLPPVDVSKQSTAADSRFIVLQQHKFQKYLMIALCSAAKTKDDKIKNPIQTLVPLDFLWETEDADLLKFFAAVHKMQQHTDGKRNKADINALKAIVKNPAAYPLYRHLPEVSEKLVATAVVPVQLQVFTGKVILNIIKVDDFYELSGSIESKGVSYAMKDVGLQFNYFLSFDNTLHLVDRLELFSLIDFLRQRQPGIAIHTSKFKLFKTQILEKLADRVIVNYQYIKPATQSQLREQGFDHTQRKLIYLSESSNHIVITPTMSYSDVEVPIRSKRQIYGQDEEGNEFMVERNHAAEVDFTALVMRQHPHFAEQLDNDLDHFYLHKDRFLDEAWFLDVFEEWQLQDILVLGFNEIEGNRLNPNKVQVNIKVLSGINWFNAEVKVLFGKKKAPLKSVQKAILNKTKYVQLDDGTLGILPAEWIQKLQDYFNAGELEGASILISRMNYNTIDALFDASQLDEVVLEALQHYRQKWDTLQATTVLTQPPALHGTLRPYQLQGLNWLNFLDDCNFGGCLADDMGLGKSIQIIAFILSQREKVSMNVNLLIVPATLISNWQAEIARFAPSIPLLTVYGNNRVSSTTSFHSYEVVLTTYGTLLSDIEHLKAFPFNYIFLDESQHIKNPESQRYKAVRLLQARNRIAITGTPIENNTFDLYSQLSFACPGLLGSKQYFRDVYATPIDTFKVLKRARELQQKIQPFLLRRTKQQVAQELPPKTEMILYCEMEAAQRKIYDAYEKEFREYIDAATDEELKKSPMHVLKGLTKLRQICNAPSLVKTEGLTEATSAKLKQLLQQIESKSGQHKILVFSQFVSMLDLVKTALDERQIPYAYLTGKTRNRGAVIDAFQNDNSIRVFLISLKAGGTGLNLTQADYVYLIDPWWNPAVENQAIDRVHRIGQERHVIAIRLICPNTVEDKILKMQQTKIELTDRLIKAEGDTLSMFRKEDLLKMLGDK